MTMDSDKVSKWVENMETDTAQIRQEALKMCWYMRGGITYDQAMQLSISERKIINDIVKENMETTKKSGLPFF